MSDKGRINRYLFSEFGYDLEHEPSTISHNWPFELHAVGMISSSGRETEVLGFAADDQDYYVLLGESLSFLPAAGMSLQDLQLQQNGQDWIDSQDPIDLATSRPLDGAVPSAIERRACPPGLGGLHHAQRRAVRPERSPKGVEELQLAHAAAESREGAVGDSRTTLAANRGSCAPGGRRGLPQREQEEVTRSDLSTGPRHRSGRSSA